MRLAVRHRVPIVVAVLAAAIAFPLGAIASHQFSDVPNTNTFHNDIDAIADAGVTTGCGGGNYCPSAFVTREQMAAFLNRLGALGPGKTPVVNAATAQEAEFAFEAQSVDGYEDVLPAADIVVDQLLPWLPLATQPGITIEHLGFSTWVNRDSAGGGSIVFPLQAPGSIGDVIYGLVSVELCYSESDGEVSITDTALVQASGGGSSVIVAADPTDRAMTTTACYTVTDAAPEAPAGPSTIELILSFADTGRAKLDIVRSTWTPVT